MSDRSFRLKNHSNSDKKLIVLDTITFYAEVVYNYYEFSCINSTPLL